MSKKDRENVILGLLMIPVNIFYYYYYKNLIHSNNKINSIR